MGNANYHALSLMETSVSKGWTKRATVTAQHNVEDQWDSDGQRHQRGATPTELLRLRSFFSDDLGASTKLDVRLVRFEVEHFWRPKGGTVFGSSIQPGVASFEDGDVRKRYTAVRNSFNESVELDRAEVMARLTQTGDRRYELERHGQRGAATPRLY